jgi:hypothetical protein
MEIRRYRLQTLDDCPGTIKDMLGATKCAERIVHLYGKMGRSLLLTSTGIAWWTAISVRRTPPGRERPFRSQSPFREAYLMALICDWAGI